MLAVEQIIACGLEKAEASKTAEAVNRILPTQSPTACWYEISRYILTPQHPFALHQFLYEIVYADFDRAKYGPPPAWFPTDEDITKANITLYNGGIAHQDLSRIPRMVSRQSRYVLAADD